MSEEKKIHEYNGGQWVVGVCVLLGAHMFCVSGATRVSYGGGAY